MIDFLLQIAEVVAVIVAAVLRVNLEPAVWQHPSRKDRHELIVGDALSLRSRRKRRVVEGIALQILLEQSLKNLREIPAGDSGGGPDGMKKSRPADFEPCQSPWLHHDNYSGRESPRTRLHRADVFGGPGDVREIRLKQLAPENSSVNLHYPQVYRLTG